MTTQQPLTEAPMLSEAFQAMGTTLRALANLADALAMANACGNDSDMLRISDVQSVLNCKQTKAYEVVRKYGTGTGKMRRIERGKLIQLQRDGLL